MIISTDEYHLNIEKALDSPLFEISSSPEGLELFLDTLELAGTNPYQEFPPPTTTDGSILVPAEVMALWFSFEVLNYGV